MSKPVEPTQRAVFRGAHCAHRYQQRVRVRVEKGRFQLRVQGTHRLAGSVQTQTMDCGYRRRLGCKLLKNLAPRARFELATLRLTAEVVQNLSAASGVAYIKLGAILLSLVAPNPAPNVCYWQRTSGPVRHFIEEETTLRDMTVASALVDLVFLAT
jgi:hypothetical protein